MPVDLLIHEIGDANTNTICYMEVQVMAQHSHRFTIADDDAVRVLLAKLVKGGGKLARREKLLRALDDAARHYKDSNQKVRQAFFHGLLTGYAVALTLR